MISEGQTEKNLVNDYIMISETANRKHLVNDYIMISEGQTENIWSRTA